MIKKHLINLVDVAIHLINSSGWKESDADLYYALKDRLVDIKYILNK